MKKIFMTLLTLTLIISCSNNMEKNNCDCNNMTHSNKMEKFKFENSELLKLNDKIIYNFHNKKGFKHSHITLVVSPSVDIALFGMDGKEYELKRQVSASGIVYASEKKGEKLIVSLHQGNLYVETDKENIEYFDLQTNKLYYHR